MPIPTRIFLAFLFLLFPSSLDGFTVSAPQSDEDDSVRRLWDDGFVRKRPRAAKKARRRNYSYRSAQAITASKNSTQSGSFVGVTLWRLRQSTSDDEVRLLVHESATTKAPRLNMTPERIEADTPLDEGQFVRLTIEAPTPGYLYVINREAFANDRLGQPYLIFPTLRTNRGDNRVAPGRIIEIPSEHDTPFYFTLRSTLPDQTGELLTIIISGTPLDLPLTRNAEMISSLKVDNWQARWAAPVERFELVGGKGKPLTKVERVAGTDQTRRLTQDEPLPQTIYRVLNKPGSPVLLNISLNYKAETH